MSDHESDSSEAEYVVQVLKGNTLDAVAEYLKSSDCKNVYAMVGAGMSVAAGIPDFRSPKTGLYANLEALGLPYPEAVFQLSFFRENPKPFYTFAKDFDPSIFRPTLSHSFITLLHKKGLLRTCFTQNIDGLERRAHLPAESLVEAHGTIASQHCVECERKADADAMWASIRKGEVFYCSECSHPVKPDIVFFGEALPKRFLEKIHELEGADLLLIFGTSLTVYPFASLTQMVDVSTPRVLFNLEEAGNIGHALNDVLVLDECDKGVRALCDKLGWTQELEEEWATTALPPKEPPLDATEPNNQPTQQLSGTDTAEDKVEKLAQDLAATLQLDQSNEQEATNDNEPATHVSHTSTDQEPLPTKPSLSKEGEVKL